MCDLFSSNVSYGSRFLWGWIKKNVNQKRTSVADVQKYVVTSEDKIICEFDNPGLKLLTKARYKANYVLNFEKRMMHCILPLTITREWVLWFTSSQSLDTGIAAPVRTCL